MPYWSIGEWRACIGSSWCALGRPQKIKSAVRYGARIVKKELTLSRIVTMLILLTTLIGMNIVVRGLVVAGYHHQLIRLFEDFLGLLHQNFFTLNSALVLTVVLKAFINSSLKRSQKHSAICKTYSSSLIATFLLYMVFLVIKMIYPAMNLIPWLVPAVAMIHALDVERILSLLWILMNNQEEVNLKYDQNGSVVTNRREGLRILSCILDVALSVAASVIVSLLLLSGDVEQNPGPDLDYNSVDAAQTLNKDDLPDVLEAVLPIKSVYFDLGRALRLETSDLKSIRKAYPSESDAELAALSDTLELWLQQKYKSRRFGPPTWRMLVEAVDRKVGGNDRELARKIASEHPAAGATTTAQPSQPPKKKIKLEDVADSATSVQASQAHEIREDVLLTPDNAREIIDLTWPYRALWKLIGIDLGIVPGTLDAIDKNNKKVEDCLIELITSWLRNTEPRPTRAAIDAVLSSEHILSVAAHDSKSGATVGDKLREHANYLKSLYKAKMQACFHDKDHWPPPVTKKVFRLAMIKAEKVERRKIDDDFVKSTITGRVDDILRRKVPVELENIFKETEGQQRKILIEGAPGCGKSTLSQYICHQWAEGELFQEYKQVILVRLREEEVQNAKAVADMLPRRDDSMGEETAKALNACDGQDVLFVIDGWDEMPQSAAGHSIIANILKSTKLHKCSIIITSRPVASMSLLDLVNSRIEILGFTKDELRQYFADCLENDNSKVVILQQRIQENPVVAGSCYLPLNASILVHLFKCDDELPETQFEIFSALICNCIYRHLKKTTKDKVPAIESLDELPQSAVAPFKRICEIAYEGVMEEKIIFKLKDNFNTLGLLQGVESFAKYGMLSCSYNFPHLSIQELLAAVHMATQLDDKQQVEQFTKLFGRPRFSAVFRFYAARTKLKIPEIKDIVIHAVKTCLKNKRTTELTPDSDRSHQKSSSFSNFGHEPQPLLVTLLHCLYEAQDKDLCQLVVTELKQELNLSGINLDPADCLTVGYVLTFCKDFDVDLSGCNIGDDCCKTLFKQDGDYSGLLELNLGNNPISAEGAAAISIPMKTMTNLKDLRIYKNSLGEQGVKAISEALKTMSNLQTLILGWNSLGSEGAIALSETLKSLTTLQMLGLDENSIGDDGAKAISEAMKKMTNLQWIQLFNNSIGDDGAVEMSEAMKTLTNLKSLSLQQNSIGDNGAMAISEAMKTLTNLEHLYLYGNSISDDGAVAISEAMKTLTNLKRLLIKDNFIGEAGRAALSAAAKQSGTYVDGLDENEQNNIDSESESESD